MKGNSKWPILASGKEVTLSKMAEITQYFSLALERSQIGNACRD